MGNAKTIRNNNSSRFGKYMEIVDYRSAGRRAYHQLSAREAARGLAGEVGALVHIFYLLAGATEQERTDLALQAAGAYASLNQTGCLTVPGFRDGDEHIAMRQAMTQVGFAEEEQLDVLKLVVAILDLLNITFAVGAKTPTAAPGAAQTALTNAARLLSIEPAKLEGALTHRTISARGENIRSPLTSSEECQETAKAFAKAAYARMFTALVERVNKAIEPPGGAELVLGVLDIYGFEIFELNSFEQLCINYRNEKLQQYFIDLTLRAEQEEYAAEGIAWEAVDYFNNKVVCELIEASATRGCSPISTRSPSCRRGPTHLLREGFQAPRLPRALHAGRPSGGAKDDLTFTIRHYAGDVSYSSRGLLEKNKDQLYVDLLDAAGASHSLPYVVSLFPEAKGGATARKRPVSAGTQFRASMADLVTALAKASPHYIRCIKPNDEKKAGAFDVERVTHQVRYLGLLENVRVRRAGYAFRQPLELFASRFKILSPALWPKSQLTGDARAEAKAILSEVAISDDAYKFGKTKIFIRKPLTLFMLEELRARKLHDAARMLQAPWRAYQARKYFLDLREQAQGIFGGRKRRRGSWALYFIGDYIRAQESAEVQRTLTKHKESRILFADVADKVNRKRVTQSRALVITEGRCTRRRRCPRSSRRTASRSPTSPASLCRPSPMATLCCACGRASRTCRRTCCCRRCARPRSRRRRRERERKGELPLGSRTASSTAPRRAAALARASRRGRSSSRRTTRSAATPLSRSSCKSRSPSRATSRRGCASRPRWAPPRPSSLTRTPGRCGRRPVAAPRRARRRSG